MAREKKFSHTINVPLTEKEYELLKAEVVSRSEAVDVDLPVAAVARGILVAGLTKE